jgi:hypothetical protein
VPEAVSQQLLLPEGAAGQAFWQSLSDVQLEGQLPPPPPELEVVPPPDDDELYPAPPPLLLLLPPPPSSPVVASGFEYPPLPVLLNPLVAGAVELQPTIATTAERKMPVCSDDTRLMARAPRRGFGPLLAASLCERRAMETLSGRGRMWLLRPSCALRKLSNVRNDMRVQHAACANSIS